MAIISFLFHLFLFYTFEIQGSSAVTEVFVKTGDDIILNLTEAEIPSSSRIWVWQFKDVVLVEFKRGSQPDVVNNRSGKVEVLEKSYSVKLKDLQKSHSGIYAAKILSPKAQTLSQYNITVQDPVSSVNLTLNSTPSTSPCILTATCRTDDSSISVTLRCEGLTCKREEGESRGVTKSGSSLHIYQLKESITCNHSNQVSWTESRGKIASHCPQNGEPRKHYEYFTLILLVLLPLILYILCRRKKAGNKDSDTIYAVPEVNNQTETLNEAAEGEACSPTTTYSAVGASLSKGPTKPRGNGQPETVYSEIQKPS